MPLLHAPSCSAYYTVNTCPYHSMAWCGVLCVVCCSVWCGVWVCCVACYIQCGSVLFELSFDIREDGKHYELDQREEPTKLEAMYYYHLFLYHSECFACIMAECASRTCKYPEIRYVEKIPTASITHTTIGEYPAKFMPTTRVSSVIS